MEGSAALSQSCLAHLLKSIEKKRQLSLKEFVKTDLNRGEPLEDTDRWYEQIAAAAKKLPPTGFVRCLEIDEDENGQVKSIRYRYSDEADPGDTIFVIHSVAVGFERPNH